MKVDVFLGGVTIEVPDGTDPDSEAGYRLVKARARERYLELLNTGDFDIEFDPAPEYD